MKACTIITRIKIPRKRAEIGGKKPFLSKHKKIAKIYLYEL